MFWRLLWKLLRASRGRLVFALLALASGGAVISALVNLQLDAQDKLSKEFRSFGANIVVEAPQDRAASAMPAGAAAGGQALLDETAIVSAENAGLGTVVASSPYLYVVAHAGSPQGAPVVVAGAWLDQMAKLEPWWKIQGGAIEARDDLSRCLVGRKAAQALAVAPGSQLTLAYGDQQARLSVAGIVDAGGNEDGQIFVNLPVAQKLAGLDGKIQVLQLSVLGSSEEVAAYASRLAAAMPGLVVRPVRQFTEAEGALVGRIRLLIFAMVLLILLLTSLCVLAAMAALAMERRADVGLMKALGGSINRVVGLFLAEASLLGAAGGALGYFAGVVLAHWMGERIFGARIEARAEVLPLMLALMIGVALAGALPLRMLGRVRPAVILRGEG